MSHGAVPDSIGRFAIKRQLGRGAMGVVYLGEDPVLGRQLAIKAIQVNPGLSESETRELRLRFENEARSAANLSHPNLVTVYEAGLDDDNLFIAMEFVAGESLSEIIASDRVLSYKEVADLVLQIGSALDHAHGEGIVHRDIKPGNILVNRRGQPKITDFGVARQATSTLTATGTIIGTPAYMSPEQITGHTVTGASDQFALGIVVYELLTGRKPFEGEGATTVLYKIVHQDPDRPVEVQRALPEAIDEVLLRALAKNPADRYPDCATLADAIRGALGAAPADGATMLTAAAQRRTSSPPSGATSTAHTDTDPDAATRLVSPGETARPPIAAAVDGARSLDPRVLYGSVAVVAVALVGFALWMVSGPGSGLASESAAVAGSADGEPAVPTPRDPSAPAGVAAIGSDTAGGGAGTAQAAVPVYSIESRPPGAAVFLNGDRLRVATPADVMLREGERHDLRLELPGHEPVGWAFEVADLSEEQQRRRRLFFPMRPLRPLGEGRPGGGGGSGGPRPGPRGQPSEAMEGPRPVRVRGDIQAPDVIDKPEPVYPEWAAEEGLSRFVVIELVIDSEGRVREARPLRAVHPQLEELAINAVYEWRFRPATRNGEPIAVFHNVSVNFRQEDGGDPRR